MSMIKYLVGIQQKYAIDLPPSNVDHALQSINPKTGKPFFIEKEKRKCVFFVKKGFWQPRILTHRVDEQTIFSFGINGKLHWLLRFLFESIIAACAAIVLTYFVIPKAAPIFYASALAVLLPAVIFLSSVFFIRQHQRSCVQKILNEINSVLEKDVSPYNKKHKGRAENARSIFGALFQVRLA